MFSSHFLTLSAFASLLSVVVSSDDSSICYSYGVDFVDEGEYFINSNSNDPFTLVSTFEGCSEGSDKAEVLVVDPNSDESFCSSLDTTPADTPMLSTCPFTKSQMFSGHWLALILGNNDDGSPFAWQRDLYLDVAPQATTTYTPTVTYSITTTPTDTTTLTSIFTSNLPPKTTSTIATATRVKTIIPSPVTTTQTTTYTKTKVSWTVQLSITTKTVTATCTLPGKPNRPDKPCEYHPTLINPAALATPTGKGAPQRLRFARKIDRAVDVEYARRRIEAAKLKRDRKANAAAPLQERAPDAPTITSTALIPVNTTTTITAQMITETTCVYSITTLQLPDVTLCSGVTTSTTTLPPVTKTRKSVVHSTVHTTKTVKATFTRVSTTTPPATITSCKAQGGHIGSGRW